MAMTKSHKKTQAHQFFAIAKAHKKSQAPHILSIAQAHTNLQLLKFLQGEHILCHSFCNIFECLCRRKNLHPPATYNFYKINSN
jgi:hypothetical protein